MNLRFFLKLLPVSLLFASLLISSCGKDDPTPNICDTTNVSFTDVILPIMEQGCRTGCHNGDTPSSGFTLENYADVKAKVDQGRLAGAVSHDEGFTAMPLNMDKLADCEIDQIKAWIDQGALDN